MKSFTFSLMLLQQRVDEALRLERHKAARDPLLLWQLGHRKRLIADRLRRSLDLLEPARS